MSLLSKDNFISLTTIPCDGCFYSLFESSYISDASSLILPAMVLTKRCYYSMFSECPVLTTAPEQLPATTLADNCYKYMFG
ncbi:MAG: hypothetical protein MJ219_00585 [Mycoplasmoidaceae bacterium]|nr:hypothetical protein [Mycoplasmoidaceae bacterium]